MTVRWQKAWGIACRYGKPGGGLRQFANILEALRVLPIDAAEAEVVEPDLAEDDEEYTELFWEAVRQLHEDLVRNEPGLARSLTVPWERLGVCRIRNSAKVRDKDSLL